RAAIRCSWRVYAFVIMSNHLHVVLKTPQPNLAGGMQAFLSGYANGWSRRHRFPGHVFQGRYRTELVEDETYLWTVTRYVHLNPVRGRLVSSGDTIPNSAAFPWGRVSGVSRSGPDSAPATPERPRRPVGALCARGSEGVSGPLP